MVGAAGSHALVVGVVFIFGHDKVPSVEAVLAAVCHDVTGEGRVLLGVEPETMGSAAAIDAGDEFRSDIFETCHTATSTQ